MRRSGSVCLCALLLACVLLIMVASASYPMFHYDVERTGNVSGDVPMTNDTLWSTDLGGFVGSSPIVSDGRVYASNWEMGAGDYGLYCLDEQTGTVIWENPLNGGDGTASTAAISGDRIFVGSKNGYLYCINASNGTTIWNKNIETSPAYWGVASSPLIYNDTVFVMSFSDGKLHAFDFDGNEMWNFSSGNSTFYYTSPAAMDSNLFFAGKGLNNALYCVNISTHEERWNFTTDRQIKSTPAIWNDTVLFASENKMYAVNASTGTEIWNNSLSCVMSSPAVSSGKVYIGSSDKKMYCYDGVTGVELWNCGADGVIQSSPVVANDTVFFGTSVLGAVADGTVYALNTTDGSIIWSYCINQCVMSSPAVSDGILFIGADDGSVYAFGEKPAITAKIRVEGSNETVWSGEVTFSNSTIVDTNGTSHHIPYPSALGALDEASKLGNFSYEVVYYPEYDSLYAKTIGNESDWWHYWINYTLPSVGADKYEIKEGDYVLWGYSESWSSSPLKMSLEKDIVRINETFNVTVFNVSANITTPLENTTVYVDSLNYSTNEEGNATISLGEVGLYEVYAEKDGYIRSEKEAIQVLSNIATINVRIEGQNATIWSVKVTFSNSTIVDTDNISHYLDKPTALGVVEAASKLGNFFYEVENQTWGLFLKSISGEAYDPTTWDGWMYRVDYYSPTIGAAGFVLNVTEPPSVPHDEVLWYYGSWTDSPLKITLDKTGVKVNEQFTATVESYNDTTSTWELLDNATVYVDSSNYTTDINGIAVISIPNAGSYTVYAEKEGYIRSEKKTVTVTPTGDDGGGDNGGTTPSVRIDVDYRYIGDIYSGDISFVSGMTVLDALDNASKSGEWFSYDTKEASWGTYVYKIEGIEEKSEGPTSGWMYWVNGAAPSVGCAEKTLQNQDKVIWYWSASMSSVPPTEYPPTGSSGGTDSGSALTSSQTTTLETIEETKKIEVIEAGENTSVTFEKTNITRVVINANNTIRNATITIRQIGKPANITNVSGMSYCYFNITTTNLTATNITNATIEFKVNKSGINENDIDEMTITLNRYSNITRNWCALPTTKIEGDNTSLYFESETPGFSFFAVSGEKKTVSMATTEAPTAEATAIPVPLPKVTPVSSTPTPVPLSTHIHGFPGSLILIVIAVIVIGGIIIVVVLKRKK